jgi:hypothetical protein
MDKRETTPKATRAGRPSMTSPGHRSPQMTFVIPESWVDGVNAAATKFGLSKSEVGRRALGEWLEEHQLIS